MDLIKRPKKAQKAERGYLTNEKYQDYAETQFKNIYDYLDGVYSALIRTTLFKNKNNSTTTITLSETVENYDYIEVFYKVSRGDGYNIKGKETIISPQNVYFNLSCMFRESTAMKGSTSLYKITTNTISLISGANYEFSSGAVPIFNNNNSIFITQVIGYKRKE